MILLLLYLITQTIKIYFDYLFRIQNSTFPNQLNEMLAIVAAFNSLSKE